MDLLEILNSILHSALAIYFYHASWLVIFILLFYGSGWWYIKQKRPVNLFYCFTLNFLVAYFTSYFHSPWCYVSHFNLMVCCFFWLNPPKKINDMSKKFIFYEIANYLYSFLFLFIIYNISLQHIRKVPNAVNLSFPLQGKDWVVTAGGSSVFFNHHFNDSYQKWALDIAPKIPLKNGQDLNLYAPCSGEVIELLKDYTEGFSSQYKSNFEFKGNFIILRCREVPDIHVMLAHIEPNTITANLGDFVEAKSYLGKVGNTGRSTREHLHIQANRMLGYGLSESVPMLFDDEYYVAFDQFEPRLK